MHVVVFGATGPLGRRIVEAARPAGHQVTAFVRTPGRLGTQAGLREVTGDVLDARAVAGRRGRARRRDQCPRAQPALTGRASTPRGGANFGP